MNKNRINKKTAGLALFSLMLLLVLTTLFIPQNTESQEYKIGVIVPTTGHYAFYGEKALQGAQLAQKKFPFITLIVEDDQGETVKAVSAANKLIYIDNVTALMTVRSSISAAVAEAAQQGETPLLYSSTIDFPAEENTQVFKNFINIKEDCRTLAKMLKGKKGNKKLCQERKKYSFLIFYKDTLTAFYGKEAEQKEKEYYGQTEEEKDVDEIAGTSANPGTVTAKARLLLTSDKIGEMQQGEVLVTAMTTPDFVPAMRKASAIITDEGGILCHAAIVSRELGIPCIVGTRIATKTIKTGDLLEVRANHGIVKKIK